MSRTIESVGLGIDLSKNFIRGAARVVVADLSVTPFPAQLNDMVRTSTTTQDEQQTITITGTPTGGTFTLTYKGYTTGNIAYNAAASAVVSALVLLPTIGTGGVTATGGPGPGTPYVVTFASQNSGQAVPLMTATGSFTGGTTPAIAVTRTTAGFGQWDAQSGWTDLGPTKGGITIVRNNSEETFDVDQLLADIMSLPTAWEMSVQASYARNDIDLLQLLWEGGTITTDGTTGERTLPLGAPTGYTQKRVGVLFQRTSLDGGTTPGKVRAYCFRICQRTPQESSIVHNKTGDQATIPFTWKALVDPNIVDPRARFGSIIDQA
jgi:hypothetical protein